PVQHVQARRAAGPHDEPGAERLSGQHEWIVHGQPPCTAVTTSTWSPAASRVDSQAARRTTSPLTAAATPWPPPPTIRDTAPASEISSATGCVRPLMMISTALLDPRRAREPHRAERRDQLRHLLVRQQLGHRLGGRRREQYPAAEVAGGQHQAGQF